MSRPSDNADALNVIVLGTMTSPGVVTLSGHDRAEAWDIQPAKGHTGASTTLNGKPPGQFQASFYLADDSDPNADGESDFDRWDVFQRLIESTTSGPTPFALPIYHPDLVRNRYTEVTSGGVGGMVHDGKGGATVVVKFLEYRPAKKKKAAAPGAKAGPTFRGSRGGPESPPDPNATAKAELAALTLEAQKP